MPKHHAVRTMLTGKRKDHSMQCASQEFADRQHRRRVVKPCPIG